MHFWGDKNVDWEGIDSAAEFIGEYLQKYGRIHVSQYKEKFGTVRVYCTLGWSQIQNITYPGYHFLQRPIWLNRISLPNFINYLIIPYHKWIYKRAYKLAIKKWPHLKNEIINGADFSELLEN